MNVHLLFFFSWINVGKENLFENQNLDELEKCVK